MSDRRRPGARLAVRREVARSFAQKMVHTCGRTRAYAPVMTSADLAACVAPPA